MDFLIFFGFMLVCLATFAVVAVRRGLQLKKLAQEGQPAKGRILKKSRVHRGKGRRSETLTYEFQDSFGQAHRRRIHVSPSMYEQHEEGGLLDVVYLLENPKVNGAKQMVDLFRNAMGPGR